jgi:NADPH2:quinone reductase
MRAGGPEVIDVTTEDTYVLKPDEALVHVEAVGLNHIESLLRGGGYSIKLPFPYPVGVEGAGTIVDCVPGVDFAPGTRVCWTGVLGSCATCVNAPAAMLARLPDSLTFEDGASLAHGALTAAGLVRHWPLEAGSTAVVWAAAGAVGRLLVATLERRGVCVAGIASGARVDDVKAAGAALVIDRLTEDIVAAVRGFTDGRGAAAVFDPIGVATWETSLKLLAPRGCIVNYGQLSGELPTVDLNALMDAGSVFVTKYGPKAGLLGRMHIGRAIEETLALAETRPMTSGIAGRFTLDGVADAYRLLDSKPQGKVIVLPQS